MSTTAKMKPSFKIFLFLSVLHFLYVHGATARMGKKKTKFVATYLSSYGYTTKYTENRAEMEESIKDFQFYAGLPTTGEFDPDTEKIMKKGRCGMKDPNVRGERLKASSGKDGRLKASSGKDGRLKASSGKDGRFKASSGKDGRLKASSGQLKTSSMKDDDRISGQGLRVRRYVLQGSRWDKRRLTWRYKHNPNSYNAWRTDNRQGLHENTIRDVIKKAMHVWTQHTNIEFIEDRQTSAPDIWIKFVRSRHRDDPFPFDGSGGTLAHAFYPLNNVGLSGDVHFDDDEYFTVGNSAGRSGKDLMWVAVHELGHTLGLDHSRVRNSIMFPFYSGYQDNINLRYDDKVGVQTLYGPKRKRVTTDKKKKPTNPNKVCPRSKVTSIFSYKNNYVMITQGERLYVVNSNGGGITQANVRVKKYFDEVEFPIDAVYQTNMAGGKRGGVVYNVVFTRSGYYLYNQFKYKSGPHPFTKRMTARSKNMTSPIKLAFPDWVQRVDAAMKWWPNNKVYFFIDHWYWRYDETSGEFDRGYPKMILYGWRGLPGKVDAAYCSYERKETFFTIRDQVYRMKERPRPVRLKPNYPKNIKEELLLCEDA